MNFEYNNINIINGDSNIILDSITNKSVQLICIDPPYNIGKDTWDKIDNYMEFLINIIIKLETKLKDNGSFFIFHNSIEIISELMIQIKNKTNLKYKQFIVWNKRFDGSSKKGYMDGFIIKEQLHNFNKMAEYILFYTFDNTYKLKKKRMELKLNQIVISQEIKSKNGLITGWYSNIENGKNLPTIETIKPIEKHLNLSFDDIVPKFRNMKTHHSVWNYDIAPRCSIHLTPKPIDLLKNIIIHTTDENDLVLDCFAGTGSLGLACLELKRKCILIEINTEYCNYIKDKLLKLTINT
jgi:site-specific DNA-methyltransferase (adenine-specific)